MSDNGFNAPSPEAMNKLIPAYDFLSVATSNELGAVYFANQRSLDRHVAIKIYAPTLGNDPVFRKTFETACKRISGLRHPNLIGLIDSGRIDGMPFSVMEFVSGKSLARSTRGKMIDPDQSMRIMDAVCEGLSNAHENGLIHGNLDTASILLTKKTEPKIGNFGLTRAMHTDPSADPSPGSIAPEALDSLTPPTVLSDVFSLGAIFYSLITGRSYGADAKPASEISGCRKELDEFVKRTTSSDPFKRLPDTRTFQVEMQAAAAGKKRPAEKPNPAANLQTTRSKDPKLKATVSVKAKSSPSDQPKLSAGSPQRAPASAQAKQPSPNARKKQTDAAPNDPKTPVNPAPKVKVGFDWSLPLKIAMIIGLLFAIHFTWQTLKEARLERERENRLQREKASTSAEPSDAARTREKQLAAALEARKRSAENTKPVEPEPEPETSGESLDRLASRLASGMRTEMPVGSAPRGGSHYLFVARPMTWSAAAEFAERHGAHLASPDTDPAWLSAEISAGKTSWIGAAKNGDTTWAAIDGSRWNPPEPPPGNGHFLALSGNGLLLAEDFAARHPPILQWHDDGSNPGTLRARLEKTRESLNTQSPDYPPGARTFGNRRYLRVPRKTTWTRAAQISRTAGGHLATVSDAGELGLISKFTGTLPSDLGIWLGASLRQNRWQWITGEPWGSVTWTSTSRAAADGAALVALPGGNWDARHREDTASGFVIEWNADASPADPGTSPESAPGDPAAELATRAEELVIAADKKRTRDLAANIKKIRWDLDAYLRGLNKSNRETWSPHVSALKDCVAENRFLTDQINPRGISVSAKMYELVAYCDRKQKEIDASFIKETRKIRDAFVIKMTGIREKAEADGQVGIAKVASGHIREASNLRSWVTSFGPDFPANPAPAE